MALEDSVSAVLGFVPRSGLAGSCGSSIFSFLRTLPTVLPGGCSSFHFHRQCPHVPASPCLRQHLLLLVFDDDRLSRCEVVAHVGLGSLAARAVEHLFMYTCGPLGCLPWENVYSVCPFFNQAAFFHDGVV